MTTAGRMSLIGTRDLTLPPREAVALYRRAACVLAQEGYVIVTGGCVGADQLAAESALVVGGNVELYLPWTTYESAWVDRVAAAHGSRVQCVIYDAEVHTEWTESVKLYHPHHQRIQGPDVAFYARHYGLTAAGDGMIALPSHVESGGAGQGIRVARALGKPLLILTSADDRARLEAMLG